MKKMIKPLIIMIMLVISIGVSAQENDGVRKVLFLEYGGMGIQYSANLDWMLAKPKCGAWAIRMGVGGLTLNPTSDNGNMQTIDFVSIPVGAHYLIGKYKTFMEVGFGVTSIFADFVGSIHNEWIRESGVAFAYFGNLAYRYQAYSKGLFFKLSWNPVVNKDGFSADHLGISFGYSFR